MIKVLLVDDQPMVTRGLRMQISLEKDVNVVGDAHTGSEALRLVESLQPDVVVMDVEMPGMDGVAATAALHKRHPGLPVILLTIHDDRNTRARAQAAGVSDFIVKTGNQGALLQAIRRACAGLKGQQPALQNPP